MRAMAAGISADIPMSRVAFFIALFIISSPMVFIPPRLRLAPR
jgi:hypothetical protein